MKFEQPPKPEQTPQENPPEQKPEKAEELNIGVGDVIINKDGTRRQVVGFDVDGRYYEVKTLKPGEETETPKEIFRRPPPHRRLVEQLQKSRVEKLMLDDILKQRAEGLIERIEQVE